MTLSSRPIRLSLVALPFFAVLAVPRAAHAQEDEETKATVQASVPDVVEAAEAVFEEMEGLQHVESAVTPIVRNFGMAAGARADGGGIQVVANQVDGGTEVTVTSSNPPDRELEQRVLAALQEELEG